MKFSLIILFAIIFAKNDGVVTLTSKVSKCHHEGDFKVFCNRTKIPVASSDFVEHIRSAKLIYGLYHNDTLCSYVPNTSCYKKQTPVDCIDKTYCNVKNGWFSLEPDCAGNSYYTQLEYDCQPAFYMCDKDSVINNVFSGLIYSPSYPSTFRSNKGDACYLTVHLPKNHHVEITLDYFDMLKTSKCVGDYVEIQQYKETAGSNGNGYGHDTKRLHSGRRSLSTNATGDGSQLRVKRSFEMSIQTTTKPLKRIKLARQHRRPKYKWQTLGTMCGRIDKPYTIRATADTINFKFRPLPANHPYVASLNNYPNRNHLGFKIYFQAIPPKAPPLEDDDDLIPSKISQSIRLTTPASGKTDEKGMTDETNSDKSSTQYNIPTGWMIALIVIVICIFLFVGGIIALVIFILKKKMQRSKSTNASLSTNKFSKTSKDQKSSTSLTKSPQMSQAKPPPAKPSALAKSPNNLKPQSALASKKPNSLNESADISTKNPSSSSTALRTDANVAMKPTTVGLPPKNPSTAKFANSNESDTRKMIGDLPVLLQDLSTSRLLMKFKQEAAASNSSPSPSATTATTENKNESQAEAAKSAAEPSPAINKTSETSHAKESDGKSKEEQATPTTVLNKQRDSIQSAEQSYLQQQLQSKSSTTSSSPQTKLVNSKQKSASSTPTNKLVDNAIPLKTSNKSSPKATFAINSKTSTPLILDEASGGVYGASDIFECSGIYGADETSIKAAANKPLLLSNRTNNSSKYDENDQVTQSLLATTSDENPEDDTKLNKTSNNNIMMNTSPRKTAFNPLHVILKDKNKYHTTEYI